jgi:hypothetical protein
VKEVAHSAAELDGMENWRRDCQTLNALSDGKATKVPVEMISGIQRWGWSGPKIQYCWTPTGSGKHVVLHQVPHDFPDSEIPIQQVYKAVG